MAQLSRSLPEMNRLAARAESFYASPYEREPIYPKIFVGGLPPETCAEDIIQAFASYRIEVVKLPAMKQGQRFAFAPEIEVKSKQQQQQAIKMGSIMIRGRMAQIRPHNRSATRYNDGYQRELQMKKIEMERMRRSLELLYTDRYRQRYYRPQSRSYLDYDPEERRRYEMMYGDQYGYRLREQQFRRAHAPPSHADLHSEEVRKNLKWEEIKLRARLASIQEELQKGPRINPNNSSLDDVQPIHEFVPSKSISSSTNSDEDAILPHDSFSESPKEGESSRSLLILVKDADPTEGNAEPSADNSSPVADDISPVIEAISSESTADEEACE